MTFATCCAINVTGNCDRPKCADFIKDHILKFLGLDVALLISTIVVGILCALHVVQIPGGTYGFFGAAGGIVLADLVGFGALYVHSKNEYSKELSKLG